MSDRIPKPLDQGRNSESCMSYLRHHYLEYKNILEKKGVLVTDTSDRYACGFPLPSFQRPSRWTREQKIAFIESAWLGLPLGTYTLHAMDWTGDNGEALKFSGWAIDGQQRLSTIESYWNDEFPVFGLLWSELNIVEMRRFEKIKFCHYIPELWDENLIRDLYDRLAFGGTPHLESERASVKP
jgi:hypothetical protein